LEGAYAQNVKALPAYYDRIENEQLGIYRGYRLTPEDRLRRHVIMQLMCHFHLEKAPVEERFGIDFDTRFASALEILRPMEADGLVALTPEAVHVRSKGRLLVRNVAMAFDAYWQAKNDQPVHAQTV
jgi:oxygen-independent coproporphyrinogen-3 oxidase